jgi:hypothetical protein
MVNRRETRTSRHVQVQQGNIDTRTQDIINNFVTDLTQKYGSIAVDNKYVAKLESVLQPPCPSQFTAMLEQAVT